MRFDVFQNNIIYMSRTTREEYMASSVHARLGCLELVFHLFDYLSPSESFVAFCQTRDLSESTLWNEMKSTISFTSDTQEIYWVIGIKIYYYFIYAKNDAVSVSH